MPADWNVLTCFAGWLLLFYKEIVIECVFPFKWVSYFMVSVPDIELFQENCGCFNISNGRVGRVRKLFGVLMNNTWLLEMS